MLISRILAGYTVLVVHDDRFRGNYVADVLRAAGATVAGPVPDAAAGSDLLRTTSAQAIVVGVPIAGEQARALVRVAIEQGIAVLVVQSVRADTTAVEMGLPVVALPYAGFQVAETLAALLTSRAPPARMPGPVLRGH